MCNVVGYTGVQPRPEQARGTPDHTQSSVKPSDPDLMKTHCRLVPSYAGLANATTATGKSLTAAVPKLNMAAVAAEQGHAGMRHCLCLWTTNAGKELFACFLSSFGEQALLRSCLLKPWECPGRHAYTSSMHIMPM